MDGSSLKNWREAKKMTQDEVAELVGVTTQTISNFERGRVNRLSSKNMRRLDAILHEARPSYPQPSPLLPAFCLALAAEIDALREYLLSDELSGQQKAEKFRSTITYFHDHLDTYLAALRKIDRDHP